MTEAETAGDGGFATYPDGFATMSWRLVLFDSLEDQID